ncbi:hypothetical protein [Acidimangrovimonas pyrenivorans]|uniref:Uncharacterized protein n=1 Tax=Acidimangrovimonas pyrenivorans TaxID=2030798 RepID=A0ABV7ACG7_9RHOB
MPLDSGFAFVAALLLWVAIPGPGLLMGAAARFPAASAPPSG